MQASGVPVKIQDVLIYQMGTCILSNKLMICFTHATGQLFSVVA